MSDEALSLYYAALNNDIQARDTELITRILAAKGDRALALYRAANSGLLGKHGETRVLVILMARALRSINP